MVRGGKKEAVAEANPEAEERKRRKKLAFSKGILSEAPAKPFSVLSPSKTVKRHHGTDILRKSHRKNRFLFSFPGLLAPISGGKLGDLKDLGTKNPILYLDFPQIVFSDAWWIGRKDENPEETRLEFPREMYEAHHTEYDFKGGAGALSEMKQGVNKSGLKYVEQESPKTDLEDDSSDDNLQDLTQVTPVRHSERTAGKRFNFAEELSGDDLVASDGDTSEGEDQEGGVEQLTRDYVPGETEKFCPVVFDIDNEDAAVSNRPSAQVQQSATSVTNPKEPSHGNHISLVQTTISTLFKKVEEKVEGPRKKRKVIEDIKAGSENVAAKHPKNTNSVKPVKIYQRTKRSATGSTTATPVNGQTSRVSASKLAVPTSSSQVEDDDIEEFSSNSKDSDGSDEDWAG